MAEKNSILTVKDVSYAVDHRKLIDRISLEIPAGSFVGVIGPNGSGKSTLLKTVYRAYKASTGAVYLNGEEMSRMSGREIARQMAVVAQENQVDFDFSVMEIMMIGRYSNRSFLERSDSADMRICEAALEELGMLEFKDRSFLSLSGGEKQKVMIASAFSREPALIVMDEPTNHLDVGYQFLILDLLKKRRDVTVFSSIHDMNMAMQYCDHIIALKNGEVYCSGTSQTVLTPENLRELFHVRAELVQQPNGLPYIHYLGAEL